MANTCFAIFVTYYKAVMNKIHCQTLIDTLAGDVRECIRVATGLRQYTDEVLLFKTQPDAWNIVQVVAHLNIYCTFYIAACEQRLHLHTTTPAADYKPGMLGDYFVKSMAPKPDNTISRKMKTVKVAEPREVTDVQATLDAFLAHQHQLLNLLHLAAGADLGSIKVPTFLSRFISLKLGDMLRFVVAHQRRHLVQVANILNTAGLQPHTASLP